MKRTLLNIAVTLMIASAACAAERVTITVKNTQKTSRAFEMIEVPMDNINKKFGSASFIVTDADGNELPSQLTHDGTLIFQASVGAHGKTLYYVTEGTPSKYERRVMGRLFTEREDEFGWENDRLAYRIYGHGAAVGYDIFNKSTTKLMLDYWYASEQDKEMRSVCNKLRERGYADLADQVYNAFCYHIDHGQGMDCYTVGPTLGAGASALLQPDGKLLMPQCYKSYEILDDGPLRFTVRLTYPEQEYAGEKVYETRTITVDAGTSFCRIDVRYYNLTAPATIATGIVVHDSNPTAYVLNPQAAYMGYEDLGDSSPYNPRYRKQLEPTMGKIYVGTVYPSAPSAMQFDERKSGIALGHIIASAPLATSSPYTYYIGTAWDHNAELGISTLTDWEALLSRQAELVRNPLKATVK